MEKLNEVTINYSAHEVRLLDHNDINAYHDFILNKKSVFENISKRTLPLHKEKELIAAHELLESRSIIGYFDSDGIQGVIKIFRWHKFPYYTLYGYAMRSSSKIPFYKMANPLFRKAIDLMEKESRYTFYIVSRLRGVQVKSIKKFGHLNVIMDNIDAFKRYDVFLEEVVQPDKRSEYIGHNELLSKNSWEIPLLIRKGCLKQKYRLELLKDKILATYR